jgi:hypothetical protein
VSGDVAWIKDAYQVLSPCLHHCFSYVTLFASIQFACVEPAPSSYDSLTAINLSNLPDIFWGIWCRSWNLLSQMVL